LAHCPAANEQRLRATLQDGVTNVKKQESQSDPGWGKSSGRKGQAFSGERKIYTTIPEFDFAPGGNLSSFEGLTKGTSSAYTREDRSGLFRLIIGVYEIMAGKRLNPRDISLGSSSRRRAHCRGGKLRLRRL